MQLKKQLLNAGVLTGLIVLPSLANAQLSGAGELGYSNSTGNTENTALFAALMLNYDQELYQLKSLLENSYKSENGDQTEERYLLDVQGNYFLDDIKDLYAFAGLRFEKDQFADIELDTTISGGVGKTLYKDSQSKMTGEIGLGQQTIDYVSSGTDTDSQTVVIGKLDFSHQINEQVSFSQDLSYRAGSESAKLETNTGVKVKVAAKANLKLTYKYRHNDSPPAGTKEEDTQTLITLNYDF